LTLLFQSLAYIIPIFGGWLADVHLCRYTVICIGVAVCGIAHVVLVVGALPSVLQASHGVAPFVVGKLILAFGAGKKTAFLLHSFHVYILHTTWY
jgi:dipeptide/tripeptide permease